MALLVDRPDIYADYAISLWTGDDFVFHGGAASKLEVRAAPGTMHTLADIQTRTKIRTDAVSDLDWMTMASLSAARAHGSGGAVGYPKGVLSDFNAITWPSMIRRWFSAVGAPPQVDSVGTGLLSKSIKEFVDLLCLWDTHWIVLQIDASLLQGGGAFITQRHWVVMNPIYPPTLHVAGSKVAKMSPVAFRDAYAKAPAPPTDATVDLQVVSWSQDWHTFDKPTLAHVATRFYGGYACRRFR